MTAKSSSFKSYPLPILFCRDYQPDAIPVFDLRNHRGALNFPAVVEAYLTSEIQLGRVAGPFDNPPFADAFVVSPLHSVQYVAQYPDGTSIRTLKTKTQFLRRPFQLSVNEVFRMKAEHLSFKMKVLAS